MRDHDKMKDDATVHLSDQLIAIMGRLQELERRQLTAQIFLPKEVWKIINNNNDEG